MKKTIITILIFSFYALTIGFANADMEADRKAFTNYFYNKFPSTPKDDYINGVYSIDKGSREQWEAIEELPPYEQGIDKGEALFAKLGLAKCSQFKDYENGVRQNYPYFSEKENKVITLESDIQSCIKSLGKKRIGWNKGKMAHLSAYLGYLSRGHKYNVKVDSAGAKKAYEDGKRFYYAKRGQLNLSCADCHVYNSGNYVRADLLSPGLGHPSGFPVYRSKWGNMGTLHRRFGGCNKQVRAKPFKPQGKEYSNLEFFLSAMSNGLEINAPSARK